MNLVSTVHQAIEAARTGGRRPRKEGEEDEEANEQREYGKMMR